MSQFMPEKQEGERGGREKWPPERGPEEFLTNDERQFLRRYFSHPEDLPPEFQSWLVDFIAVNLPQIPISQIVGFSQFTAQNSFVLATETRIADTYDDLSTVGPQISGLGDGQYLLIYGCVAFIQGVADFARMSISINGSTPTDADSCMTNSSAFTGMSIAVVKALSNGGSNSIVAKYKSNAGASNAQFQSRWLVALRVGN